MLKSAPVGNGVTENVKVGLSISEAVIVKESKDPSSTLLFPIASRTGASFIGLTVTVTGLLSVSSGPSEAVKVSTSEPLKLATAEKSTVPSGLIVTKTFVLPETL